MTCLYPTPAELRHGRARVPEFIGLATALLSDGFAQELRPGTGLGRATLPHLSAKNLEAVLISPATCGGFHADLVFTAVPPGISNTLGRPVSTPEPTRQAAEATAVRILALLLHRNRLDLAPSPDPERVIFQLHGTEFEVPFSEVQSQAFDGDADIETAIRASLDSFVAHYMNGEVTDATIEALSSKCRLELSWLLSSALSCRICRHPV